MIDEGGFAIYLSESDREGRATWSIVTYDSRMQSNQHKQQIRPRIYVAMSSQIMEWTSIWQSSLNKAAETLSATVIRWFDAHDDFEEFDNFFDDTFRTTTLFMNRISSLLFFSNQQLCWWRTQDDILQIVDHKCSPKSRRSTIAVYLATHYPKRELTSPSKKTTFYRENGQKNREFYRKKRVLDAPGILSGGAQGKVTIVWWESTSTHGNTSWW